MRPSEYPFLPAPFRPGFPLKNPHLQTILASLKIRALGANPIRERSEETLVDAGSGIRLLGYRTVQPGARSLGLVILLHGWEGSSESTYMLTTGRRLYRSGYDVPPQPSRPRQEPSPQ